MNAGESATVDLLLINDQDIAGFQFQLIDMPNAGQFITIEPTERAQGFGINFQEQVSLSTGGEGGGAHFPCYGECFAPFY